MSIRFIILCTVSTGLDAIAEVIRNGFQPEAIIGLHPQKANPSIISGYVDISNFAKKGYLVYTNY